MSLTTFFICCILVIIFRRWLTIAVIFIVEIILIMMALGAEPVPTWGGWMTCPKGQIINPYGDECKEAVKGPTIEISSLPSAGEGSLQFDAPVIYSQIQSSPITNNYSSSYSTIIVSPGYGQTATPYAIVPAVPRHP